MQELIASLNRLRLGQEFSLTEHTRAPKAPALSKSSVMSNAATGPVEFPWARCLDIGASDGMSAVRRGIPIPDFRRDQFGGAFGGQVFGIILKKAEMLAYFAKAIGLRAYFNRRTNLALLIPSEARC